METPELAIPERLTAAEAIKLQQRLRGLVRTTGRAENAQLIAGADISWSTRGTGYAGVILYRVLREEGRVYLQEAERASAKGPALFPYIPGLLTFREAPLLLEAFGRLKRKPDLIFLDGQGIAHPRRMGIACYMGLALDTPAIGCAKSLLCGEFEPPDDTAGAYAPLQDRGEVIGAALRTRPGATPIFVSVGHRLSLEAAVRWTIDCADRYRVPRPTREADDYVARFRKEQEP